MMPHEYSKMLLEAVGNNAIQKVRTLLAVEQKALNESNEYGETPLYIAAKLGHQDIVNLLLTQNNIEINQSDEMGHTPLHMASRYGHISIVQLLLLHPTTKVNIPNRGGQTPLHVAVQAGDFNIARLLLSQPGIDLNLQDIFGNTPLHIAVASDQLEMIKLLFAQQRVKCNLKNIYGESPLHIATWYGHIKIIQFLLDQEETDINAHGEGSSTPLHIAIHQGHKNSLPHTTDLSRYIAVIKLLLVYGSSFNKKLQRVLLGLCIKTSDQSLFMYALTAGLDVTAHQTLAQQLPNAWQVICNRPQEVLEQKLGVKISQQETFNILRARIYALNIRKDFQNSKRYPRSINLREHILAYRGLDQKKNPEENIFSWLQESTRQSPEIVRLWIEWLEDQFALEQLTQHFDLAQTIKEGIYYDLPNEAYKLADMHKEKVFFKGFFDILEQKYTPSGSEDEKIDSTKNSLQA